MTSEDFRAARAQIGLSKSELGRALGLDRRTIYGWEAGDIPIKPWVALALERLAQLHEKSAA